LLLEILEELCIVTPCNTPLKPIIGIAANHKCLVNESDSAKQAGEKKE